MHYVCYMGTSDAGVAPPRESCLPVLQSTRADGLHLSLKARFWLGICIENAIIMQVREDQDETMYELESFHCGRHCSNICVFMFRSKSRLVSLIDMRIRLDSLCLQHP